MVMKSQTCISSKTGNPLSVYFSEYEAQNGADYANNQYNNNLEPYLCRKCDSWHLSPKTRQTPSSSCFDCTGSDGFPKASYESEDGAFRRAQILYEEKGVDLKVYECPYGGGWHLTKRF